MSGDPAEPQSYMYWAAEHKVGGNYGGIHSPLFQVGLLEQDVSKLVDLLEQVQRHIVSRGDPDGLVVAAANHIERTLSSFGWSPPAAVADDGFDPNHMMAAMAESIATARGGSGGGGSSFPQMPVRTRGVWWGRVGWDGQPQVACLSPSHPGPLSLPQVDPRPDSAKRRRFDGLNSAPAVVRVWRDGGGDTCGTHTHSPSPPKLTPQLPGAIQPGAAPTTAGAVARAVAPALAPVAPAPPEQGAWLERRPMLKGSGRLGANS